MEKEAPAIKSFDDKEQANLEAQMNKYYDYFQFVLTTTYFPADGKVIDKERLI